MESALLGATWKTGRLSRGMVDFEAPYACFRLAFHGQKTDAGIEGGDSTDRLRLLVY